jgi:hypothetical protein
MRRRKGLTPFVEALTESELRADASRLHSTRLGFAAHVML